jgi:diacylglycerol kinase (ATP)
LEQLESFKSTAQNYTATHGNNKPHVIAFVNSKSGGQIGEAIMKTLQEAIGPSTDSDLPCTGEVCDLSKQEEPDQTIAKMAEDLKSFGARRSKKLLVCGGDGTVTWILTALDRAGSANPLLKEKLHLCPVAIVPLGTGNDLARSLGWGSKLRAVGDVLDYVRWVIEAKPVPLDQWRVIMRPHAPLDPDHKLELPGSHPTRMTDEEISEQLRSDIQQALGPDFQQPSCNSVYVGFWQNYFSIGLDAKVAYSVDRVRSESSLGRFWFRRGCGKLCYAWQGVRRACCNSLLSRALDVLRIVPAVGDTEDFEDLDLEDEFVDCARGRIKQLMMVNINSYGGGLNILPPARDTITHHRCAPDDGLLEVLGVRNAFFSLTHFARLRRPAYITSSKAMAFRVGAGEFMQLDGEPWRLACGCDVLVEPHRKLTMLVAPSEGPYWRGHVTPDFWKALRIHSAIGGGAYI